MHTFIINGLNLIFWYKGINVFIEIVDWYVFDEIYKKLKQLSIFVDKALFNDHDEHFKTGLLMLHFWNPLYHTWNWIYINPK